MSMAPRPPLLLGLESARPLLGPARTRRSPRASTLRYSSLQAGDSLGEEARRMFLAERQAHGDFVTRISDMKSAADVAQQPEDAREDVMDDGMLRLAATRDWVSGESSLPVSKRLSAKDRQNDNERRKELNLLSSEIRSFYYLEAAISYAFGFAFSCLYLQLLYRHADSLSKKDVPEIFLKKVKRIGIRSEDLNNTIEYIGWYCKHFQISILNFELVPGMMGFFAYKAAALVQVYRDNVDLRLILPDEDADNN
ncbi:hypothetical protein GUJ93_ZPchr0003g18062 [Zizania palustris]|uniref:Uncharacterized protein n=1 Tax=Zizania palustris TaxID=103762 RepID=A0A8J5SWR7_ZIZPA|nr:hypothetical protein GUJ93_ZPchr0003g18062 [Zizania palustris]